MNAPVKIPDMIAEIDPGLVFLQLAAARLALVEAGEMTLDEAIDGLIEPFEELFGARLCDCANDLVEEWERRYPPPPQIEAVVQCVRERGLAALKEPANIERLSRCDKAAKAEINRRIARLQQ
jgi:hypothetical protein